ncbi:elongation factor 4 [Patescibacteria group bacterium]|nr:elongation factor 4 [Patescibacteria group bacterium]
MDQTKIRNFGIIAHIDHGKSTLADRFLEITDTVSKRDMKAQLLDTMDIERERGITIKLQPATMNYKGLHLNLIDTPGHVDFNYEVSRSLAAVEGVVLVVDATQGIQAQTLANLYLALEQDLVVIPVINKIDLPAADLEMVSNEIVNLLGCEKEDIIAVSAKTGKNVETILERIITLIPAPTDEGRTAVQGLVFDSVFDDYRGVIIFVRMFGGSIKRGDKLAFIGTGAHTEVLEVGYFKPKFVKQDELTSGEIGYIVTGLKEISHARVGDTITLVGNESTALEGYKEIQSMVFAGFFCKEGDDYSKLRAALEKLKLNDAALSYEPENSPALGFGFRCGFLGLLHLEVIQERLSREFDLDLIITVPAVAYEVTFSDGTEGILNNPQDFSDQTKIAQVREPMLMADIVCPKEFMGNIMQLVQDAKGEYQTTEYLDEKRVVLHYKMPLASILADFYSALKSVSSGYASLNYNLVGYEPVKIVKLDIFIAEDKVEAMSSMVYEEDAYRMARNIVKRLKDVMPKQQFQLKIQAGIGAKIIASERLSALRKDVTSKLYGGDVTRKRKLLEKQKKGKKKMAKFGKVDIPNEAFLAILKKD